MNAGSFIRSTSLLDDSFFEKAVILIAEYNKKGATGFVVNKPFTRRLNELEEFKDSIPFPLYDGGPVDREHLFFVHQRPDLIKCTWVEILKKLSGKSIKKRSQKRRSGYSLVIAAGITMNWMMK